MKKKLILSVFLLISVTSVYSFEIFEYPFGIQPNMTKLDLEKQQDDYLKKAMGFKYHAKRHRYKVNVNEMQARKFYYDRIDINKYEQFKKLGVDIGESLYNSDGIGFKGYREYPIFQDIGVRGIIVKKTYNYDVKLDYGTKYEVKVVDVVSDKGYLDGNPDFITMTTISGCTKEGGRSYMVGEPEYNIGDEIIVFGDFITRYYQGDFNFVSDKIFQYVIYPHNTLFIRNGGVYHHNKKERESVEDIIKKIKMIDKMNDSDNFYKRSYK